MAQRVGRGIALLFHDRGTRRWVSGQQHAPAALYRRERHGTHFTGGWVGPRAGLNGRKNLVPTGIRSRTVKPVALSLYRLSYRAHVSMYVSTYCVCVCVCVYIYIYIYVCIYVCVYCVHMYVRMYYVCTYVFKHVRLYYMYVWSTYVC